jgi:integrase
MVLPRFGTTPLAAITQPEVQAWVAQLTGRGFAPATVVKAYQLLGRTLTAAVNADMIPRSPCRAVRLPKIEREEMRFLNPAEVARLADAIGPRYRALVLLGAYGGLRMGELAGLRRGRVGPLPTVPLATRPRPGFSTEAVQPPARVNVTCVTPLGEEVASTS